MQYNVCAIFAQHLTKRSLWQTSNYFPSVRGKVVLNIIYLNVTPETINCEHLVEESEYIHSRRYYEDRRSPKDAYQIVLLTGTVIISLMHWFGASRVYCKERNVGNREIFAAT